MITVQTVLAVDGNLIPVDAFAGPMIDEDYVEGAIELVVDHQVILSRDQVDLVDQLWAYLITGLEELQEGRAFSTGYPDMPVEVSLTPQGERVTIKVDARKRVAEVSVPRVELRTAMVAAATRFFAHMLPLVITRQATYKRYLARLATL